MDPDADRGTGGAARGETAGHRWALLLLGLVLVAFFAPVVFRGEVVFPHDNARELSASPVERVEGRIDTRYFSDQSSVYVPEIHHHLHGRSSGWISTWNPHVELGRPTTQVSGFGKAFLPMHALALVEGDAFRVATWLTVVAVALCGAFGLLFLRALGLHPAACFVGAIGFSLAVFVPFWLTFPMFVWGIAWTLLFLWLATRFLERATLAAGAGIAFAVHALLLSAYPQQIVWHAYAVGIFVLTRVAARHASFRERLSALVRLAVPVALGAASVAPVYADLALDAARSARTGVDPYFYLPSIPHVRGLADLQRVWGQLLDAFLWGNPIAEGYPFDENLFKGVSLTPLFAGLWLLSFRAGGLRRLWPWHALVGAALLLTFCPPAYLFAVRWLGLSLSRFPPLAGVYPALIVLAAYGADAVLRQRERARMAGVVLALAPAVALLACGIGLARIDPGRAWIAVLVSLGLALFAWTRRSAVLVALALAVVAAYAVPLRLVRPRDSIRTSSELVETIRAHTQDGSRYAIVGWKLRMLPPNQEVLLDLRSIHSYDPLASEAYRDFASKLSERGMRLSHWGDWDEPGESQEYGRQFRRVVPGRSLAEPDLSFMGIGFLVSDGSHDPRVADAAGQSVAVPFAPPILEAQVRAFERGDSGARIAGSLRDASLAPVRRTLDLDDRLAFELTPLAEETLLFVSQQHHPRWRAFSGGRELPTTAVNGFYQGVLVPPGTREVELRFLPLARWSWIPEALFAAAALGLAVRRLVAPRRPR